MKHRLYGMETKHYQSGESWNLTMCKIFNCKLGFWMMIDTWVKMQIWEMLKMMLHRITQNENLSSWDTCIYWIKGDKHLKHIIGLKMTVGYSCMKRFYRGLIRCIYFYMLLKIGASTLSPNTWNLMPSTYNSHKIQTCTYAYISKINMQWQGVVYHVDLD